MADDDVWPAYALEAAGAVLTVREAGAGATTLVFLHGLGGHAMEWWPVAARLADRFRVVAFDQRGHGRSTTHPADLSRDAHVGDVAAVLDRLAPGPVVLVGQSMGAHTALLAAAAMPERVTATVLVEGGVGGGGRAPTDEVIDWFGSWPLPFTDRAAAADWFGGGPAGSAWAAGLRADPEGLRPRFDTAVLREAISAVHDAARWQEWRAVRGPVLLVRGADGYLDETEVRRMLVENPRARLVEVPDAGHDVHLDATERLARELLAFAEESVPTP